MRRALFGLLLVGCPSPPEPPPALPVPTDPCPGYCDAVRRCEPQYAYAGCEHDCRALLVDPEASAVSGITPALVRCWSEATSCELAAACDAAEGDRTW